MHRSLCALSVSLLCLAARCDAQTGNLIPNPSFEAVTGGLATGWKPYGSGYVVDTATPHTGTASVRCSNLSLTEARSAYCILMLNQATPTPIQITGWSKADSVTGPSAQEYAIYVDTYYVDGTALYGQTARFTPGTHDWEQQQVLISPVKPIKYLVAHTLLRRHTGTAWFDDISATVVSAPPLNNMLTNPSFETVSGGTATGWTAFVSGYAVDNTVAHGGTQSIRCDNLSATDARGGCRVLVLNQTAASPILITGWSKASNVGGVSDNSYSIYADVAYMDGTKLYGQVARFTPGTHDWEQKQVAITPAKPIQSISLIAMFRYHTGTVWFDDFAVYTLSNTDVFDGQVLTVPQLGSGETRGWFARDTAAKSPVLPLLSDSGQTGWGAQQLGLQLTNVQSSGGGQVVTGTLADTTAKPRAVTLYYVEKFDVANPVWWNDIRSKGPAAASGDSSNQISIPGVGTLGTMSFYPFGCVTGDTAGRALGIPASLGPRITRIGYSSGAKLLYVAFDVALTGANLRNSDGAGHGRADVGIVRYNVDPSWGFRDAAAGYYRLFPASFTRRATKEGIWLPFLDASTVTNASDFKFAYHEGTYFTAKDDALGLLSFHYSDPTTYWQALPSWVPRTYDDAMSLLESQSSDLSADTRNGARSVLNSATMDTNGLIYMRFQNPGWIDGANWLVNPSPGLPATLDQPTKASLTYTKELADARYGTATQGVVDGEYVDGIETWRDALDYSPASLRYALAPPTFTTDKSTPVIPQWFSVYDLVSFMSNDLHQRGKLLMANGTAWRIHSLVPLVDVPGAEVEWLPKGTWQPDTDAQFNFRRTMSYHKPYLLLQNADFEAFGSTLVEKYFQRSMFYGVFPSLFHAQGYTYTYWETPTLYNRDRPLFVKYLPVIQHLSTAGWEPVTYARSSNPKVYVERYGTQYLTMLNDSTSANSATLSIDAAGFWPAGVPATVQIADEATGEVLGTFPGAATMSFTLSLQPEEARALRLTAVTGQ
jgi:hypothetical protein